MRTQSVKVLVGIVVLALIALGGYFFLVRSEEPGDSAPVQSDTLETNPTAPNAPAAGGEEAKVPVKTNLNPDLSVDESGLSKAVGAIETPYGTIRFRFYPKDAPKTVDRIIHLINSGFYNGLAFHRVVPGFVIQGGDPRGDGTGGSGQKLKAEFNERRHQEGTLAMARAADPDSADSQFYIALGPQPHLDGNYTVFGQVVEGMDIVRQIKVGDKMLQVYIEE